MTPWQIFELQLPEFELNKWATYTSRNLIKLKKPEIDKKEVNIFIGSIFACKVGGITKAFETASDGLFPASDLGRFGMKLRRFQDVIRCWEFNDEREANTSDEYWQIEQLFNHFNNHYASIVNHGTYVNVDS